MDATSTVALLVSAVGLSACVVAMLYFKHANRSLDRAHAAAAAANAAASEFVMSGDLDVKISSGLVYSEPAKGDDVTFVYEGSVPEGFEPMRGGFVTIGGVKPATVTKVGSFQVTKRKTTVREKAAKKP